MTDKRNDTITKMLTSVVDKVKKQAAEAKSRPMTPPTDHLPMPATQRVYDDRFVWHWGAVDALGAVDATMTRATQEWQITFTWSGQEFPLSRNEATALGEILLAASAYPDVWKQHVADYMVGEKVGWGAGGESG